MEFNKVQIESGNVSNINWCMARKAKEGEEKCGDVFLVKKYRDKVLLAAIDGLGHGDSAAQASERAKYLLETFNNESLINLVNHCHDNMSNKRGAVMSLALIDSWEETITWMGIGNVKGYLIPAADSKDDKLSGMVLKHGIVGYKLPTLEASMLQISEGDKIVFATDGIKSSFLSHLNGDKSPRKIIETIAANGLASSDDSLILIAEYTGSSDHDQA